MGSRGEARPVIFDAVRQRVVAIALCATLSLLILYWCGTGIERRRRDPRLRTRGGRGGATEGPRALVCETTRGHTDLVSSAAPVRVTVRAGRVVVAVRQTSRRTGRLVPFRPIRYPFMEN